MLILYIISTFLTLSWLICPCWGRLARYCTDKKEEKIFLIYKEFQKGAVAKSSMRKGFLMYRSCIA
ncbi:MAG: hypothetical protein ACK559_17385, partial [bacterium]